MSLGENEVSLQLFGGFYLAKVDGLSRYGAGLIIYTQPAVIMKGRDGEKKGKIGKLQRLKDGEYAVSIEFE